MRVGGNSAFYRVDISFADSLGRRLATFSQYFRIVPVRRSARLLLDRNTVTAGAPLIWRTANTGTTGLVLGRAFEIDHLVEGKWQLDPITPESFLQDATGLAAGAVSECQRLPLPSDFAPGQYRLMKSVLLGGADRELTALFSVVP
ncbi:MAG: immunoglobulin-like domain-containing protein [Solirubrobacterales bacterium]